MYLIRFLFLLLLSSSACAVSHDPILESIKPGVITFIGESHQRMESAKFIKILVDEALKRNQCLTVALEINVNQQPVIDRVMTEGAAVATIAISKVLDHRAMRRMIKHMAALKTKFPCLKVIAIDTGIDTPYDRDAWMAARLAGLRSNSPVLVLLGSLHTLKKVDWLVASGKPRVAEILVNKNFRVKSFPQRWIPDQCPNNARRYYRFVDVDSPEAVTILNESLMSLINAKPHKTAKGVVDGFVLWECGKL